MGQNFDVPVGLLYLGHTFFVLECGNVQIHPYLPCSNDEFLNFLIALPMVHGSHTPREPLEMSQPSCFATFLARCTLRCPNFACIIWIFCHILPPFVIHLSIPFKVHAVHNSFQGMYAPPPANQNGQKERNFVFF